VHHVGILYDQFMMHGQRNIKSILVSSVGSFFSYIWIEHLPQFASRKKVVASVI